MISIKSFIASWNSFFFTPQKTENLDLFRILWGCMLAMSLFCDILNIHDFYGPYGLISHRTVLAQFNFTHLNLFQILGPSYEATYLLLFTYAVGILGTILGLYTRTSLIIVLICMTTFHQRNIWLLSSSECLMRLTAILMVLSPAGTSLSLDSLRSGNDRPALKAPWVLRLIQIQLSVVYLWTVWHKLKGENWFDGSAVYYATRLDAMKNFPVPYLLDSVVFLKLATWGTLIIEVALGILIWFKEFRKLLIFAGLLFHFSIEWMMSIPFFEINMACLLLIFLLPEEARQLVEILKSRWRKIRESTLIDYYWKDRLKMLAKNFK